MQNIRLDGVDWLEYTFQCVNIYILIAISRFLEVYFNYLFAHISFLIPESRL